jgi:hydroxypyruvate reductase
LEQAIDAALQAAEAFGCRVERMNDDLYGDAAVAGRRIAEKVCTLPTGLFIWGGETTVALPENPGRGGRNQHLALAAALALSGRDDCWLLSAGTDGTDGSTEYAGALIDGGTVARGRAHGLDPELALLGADAGRFLEASGDLIHTGPTGTNVMDLVIALRVGNEYEKIQCPGWILSH